VLQRLSPLRVLARSRACVARFFLIGIRDPAEDRWRPRVGDRLGLMMAPPDAREIFDAIRVTLAARIGAVGAMRRRGSW